jgi:hypothetical protein
MISMKFRFFLFLFAALLLSVYACTADQLPEPSSQPCTGQIITYEADIRPIIESSCAYAGCHLGAAPGIYNDYDGLLPDLENGSFKNRVIDQRDDAVRGMPPNYATPPNPQDLTADELELIRCWLDAGFPR